TPLPTRRSSDLSAAGTHRAAERATATTPAPVAAAKRRLAAAGPSVDTRGRNHTAETAAVMKHASTDPASACPAAATPQTSVRGAEGLLQARSPATRTQGSQAIPA